MTITRTSTPFVAAIALLSAMALAPRASAADEAAEDAARIELNSASASALRALPGIGRRRAARIVDYREEFGPFRSADELADVPGISRKLVERIRPRLSVDAPKRAKRTKRAKRRDASSQR